MSTQLSLHDVTKSYDHRILAGLRRIESRIRSLEALLAGGRTDVPDEVALVVVSHDRRFVSRWRGTVIELKENSYVSQ
jgi:hypothetical protein